MSTIIMELLLIAASVAIYFLPNWIASGRNHPNKNSIFVLNLILGWTLVGWVVALVWAFTKLDHPALIAAEDSQLCPHCAETIKAAAKICRFCNRDI